MPRTVSVARPLYDSDFKRTPLTLAIADGEELAALRRAPAQDEALAGTITLRPPLHVSDDDAYLIVPDDVGIDVVDLCARGDRRTFSAVLGESIVARGQIVPGRRGRAEGGGARLEVSHAVSVAHVLDRPVGPDAIVRARTVPEIVRSLNTLPFLRMPSVARLVSHVGMTQIVSATEYLGPAWETPLVDETRRFPVEVDPTFVWSVREGNGITIKMALFGEYEEVWAYLLPAAIR